MPLDSGVWAGANDHKAKIIALIDYNNLLYIWTSTGQSERMCANTSTPQL